jgi:hypothetical protein
MRREERAFRLVALPMVCVTLVVLAACAGGPAGPYPAPDAQQSLTLLTVGPRQGDITQLGP